ncbi:MAG: polysaccharide biosynthesis C-terminal domain-containing protein, partial [Anaerolinea sp.]|nr:polysaccharide biosynthesis C-terminal domain-containing protein [Anaerolinea sp.]
PVAVGVGSIALNIILSLILIRVLGAPDDLSRGPFAGLALANTIATLLEAGALWLLLRRRIGSIRDRFVMSGAARALAAAIAMGAALALAVGLLQSNLTDAPSIIVLIVGMGIGGAVFFAASAFFGLEEAVTIPRLALRRLRR